MFAFIFKKWPILMVFAVLGAVAMNFYGYSKNCDAAESDAAVHERYAEAAPALPGYYSEELFRLRDCLNANSAAFCEAYAEIYKSYITSYRNGSLTDDADTLQSYMVFMDSYKDVLSVMSGNERSYYNALIAADTETALDSHPEVQNYCPPEIGVFQPEWAVIGVLAGAAVCTIFFAITYLSKKRS